MNKTLLALLAIMIIIPVASAYAHTTVEVGPYEIEVGWGTEPSIKGLLNTVVYSITESNETGVSSGVAGALSDANVLLKFGGIEQRADVLNDPRPGNYYTKIIPSRTGSYSVVITGQIGDVVIDEIIQIEDVQSTATLDFPSQSDSADNSDVGALRNELALMQRELDTIDSDALGTNTKAYDIALFGAAFGVAGIILAITAMIKRK